jgi:hypothetical protein
MSDQVFVFSNGCPELVGLSVLADGSNLPRIPGSVHEWRPDGVLRMAYADLRNRSVDIDLTLANLKSRGYDVARCTAKVLPFRAPSRIAGNK